MFAFPMSIVRSLYSLLVDYILYDVLVPLKYGWDSSDWGEGGWGEGVRATPITRG